MLATTRRGGGWLIIAIVVTVLLLIGAMYHTHYQSAIPEPPMHTNR